MLSELDKISCDKKYKTCIVSGTYNFRTLNDGTTPSEFATYCNRYDFVHMVGQNCCDVATDIEYILKEYISSTNKLIFCKPNTDAINTNNLAKYIRQYNCSIGGFCCGSTPILTSALKKKLCDYKVNTNRTSANISTYPMTILQYGGIVGDRINTTKNKELTE
jgi:methionine synthase I (cobalamin-dependent)